MIKRITGGRRMPTRTSKRKVKKIDNTPVKKEYKKDAPTKATTDSKGLVSLSSPKVKAKRKSVAEMVKELKDMRAKSVARQEAMTSKKSSKENKAKARTGMSSKTSGAMGRGNRKPKGGYITKAKGTPRI